MRLRIGLRFVFDEGLLPAIRGEEEVNIASLGSGRAPIRGVEGEALSAPLMLDPGVPMGGMMKAAVAPVGLSKQALLPATDIGFGKVAERRCISATFCVLGRVFVCRHDLVARSVGWLVERV